MDTIQEMRRCQHCKQPTLPDRMASLDGAADFDETCSECGGRNHCYIGADDGRRAWERFNDAWPKAIGQRAQAQS